MSADEAVELDLEIATAPARRPAARTRVEPLAEALLSPRVGVVNSIRDSHHPFGPSRLFIYGGVGPDRRQTSGERWIYSGGIRENREAALMATLAEGLERQIFTEQAGKPTYLTPEEIEKDAFSAAEFARKSASEPSVGDEHSSSPPDLTAFPWLTGRDLLSGRRRWALAGTVLPAYGHPPGHGYECDQSSTGMAAGPDTTSALIAGTAEVIERDAFAISHLNRLPLPEIDLGTVTDPGVVSVLDAVSQRPGVRVRAWDMTLDIRVPTVLCAYIFDVDGTSAIRLGAGTHVSAQTALRKALGEAVHIAALVRADDVRRHRRSGQAATAVAAHASPADHGDLGDLPDYVAGMDWLLRPRPHLRAFQELEAIGFSAAGGAQALAWLLARLESRGLRAYGFELTPPDAERATGLQVWRVIVPGAQPLVFGQKTLASLDSERLRWAPVWAGFLSSPLKDEEFNPFPHCFS